MLLESSRFDRENKRSLLFLHPIRTILIRHPEEVPALFSEIERNIGDGYFVAGYLGYECGCHFEKIAQEVSLDPSLPLAWFGVYKAPFVFDHKLGKFENHSPGTPLPRKFNYSLKNCLLGIPEHEYTHVISVIKDYIAAGDTYQVNFTDKYRFEFEGSPAACYAALRQAQRVGYGAFINAGGKYLLSFSPELFFRADERRIITRPMKGTARRGKHSGEDLAIEQWLRDDEKNRSENLMIVDLVRNDLGRIAEVGSVAVRDMFAVEKYETLFQMTSTIGCAVASKVPFYDIFRSLFPSGSVTGAPKIRTMQIIHELEPLPRGVYTGSIGFISPSREAAFNIAIRTLVLNGASGEMGIGSGIVFDSDPHQEYEECKLKAKFLTEPQEQFQLIESIFWEREYRLLALHLERMRSSADFFGFVFEEGKILDALIRNHGQLLAGRSYKVRVLLDADGSLSVTNHIVTEVPSNGRVIVSGIRTSSEDRFLYHKTTRRQVYEQEFAEALEGGYDDVLFRNEKDEVTEGAVSNVFVETEGKLYTPPVSSGLLPGIYRQHILQQTSGVTEKVLSVDDVLRAGSVFICNAIRGMRRVQVIR